MSFITPIFTAITSFFNWATGRSAAKNAPAVVAAKKGQEDADSEAKTADAVQRKDTNEIRNEIAE